MISVDKTQVRTVADPLGPISFTLTRKPVKNLNLRIRRDGSVAVSAHPRIPLGQVDAFVLSRAALIRAAQERFARLAREALPPLELVSGEAIPVLGEMVKLAVEPASRNRAARQGNQILLALRDPEDQRQKKALLDRYLREEARRVFTAVLAELYPLFQPLGVAEPGLKIRDMRSRWGSCLVKKGVITLNLRLLAAPRPCIAYVALHECCHFLHPNHGKGFYQLLSALMPDWRERKRQLEETAGRWL